MRKLTALILAASLVAALFSLHAFAENAFDEMFKVLMSTPGVKVTRINTFPKAEELRDAITGGDDLIPGSCKLDPERITVVQAGKLSFEEEDYYVTFKFWSSVNRTIALFFLAEDAEEWEMISCNLGDVIEGYFTANGTYAITVSW